MVLGGSPGSQPGRAALQPLCLDYPAPLSRGLPSPGPPLAQAPASSPLPAPRGRSPGPSAFQSPQFFFPPQMRCRNRLAWTQLGSKLGSKQRQGGRYVGCQTEPPPPFPPPPPLLLLSRKEAEPFTEGKRRYLGRPTGSRLSPSSKILGKASALAHAERLSTPAECFPRRHLKCQAKHLMTPLPPPHTRPVETSNWSL